jgi:hypothetical protein
MRKLRTRQQIGDWITQELRKHAECADARVSVQYELDEPEADGCNWADNVIVNSGVNDRDDVLERLRPILREARRTFNVSEPSP